MLIDVATQSGAPAGYTVAGDVLHGPDWTVDFSALQDGDSVLLPLRGSRGIVRRVGSDIVMGLALDGPASSFSGNGDIGTGAPGGPAVPLGPITSRAEREAARRADAHVQKWTLIERLYLDGALQPAEIVPCAKGDWPPSLQTDLDAMPAAQRIIAAGRWASDPFVYRDSPIVAIIQAKRGYTDAQVDAFFDL